MNFSFYIAKRYLFSRNSNSAIHVINRIASVGIIVGAMALFIVLSVFSGLKNFSLSFSNALDPDLKVSSTLGKSFFVSEAQERKLKTIEGVVAISKVIEERVLFSFNDKQNVTYIKGVDVNYGQVTGMTTKLFNGQWLKKDTYQAVVGYGLAQQFSMGIFDYKNPLEVMAPKAGKGTIDSPEEAFNTLQLLPVGIYAISDDLDSKYVFADIGLVQELLAYKNNQVSAIEIKTKTTANKDQIANKVNVIFNNNTITKNRQQLNEALYKMLNTENLAVYLIFTLVIIVALFNLIGALIMMILDKKTNLTTLVNLGAEIKNLQKIFLIQGTLLSFLCGIIGLFLGIIIVLIQFYFQPIMITPSLPYPVVFLFQNVIIVFATILFLGFFASFIASKSANKKLLE